MAVMKQRRDDDIHERVATIEANMGNMTTSVDKLSESIGGLNDKLESITNRISLAMGGFAVIVFIISYFKK